MLYDSSQVSTICCRVLLGRVRGFSGRIRLSLGVQAERCYNRYNNRPERFPAGLVTATRGWAACQDGSSLHGRPVACFVGRLSRAPRMPKADTGHAPKPAEPREKL